jgi:hypothetical protein
MLDLVNARTMTARALLVDRLAVEVSGALAADGVRAVLLKGAAVATWLYEEGACRPYGDADVLVAPADSARAERTLTDLGVVLRQPGLSPVEETPHARLWVRGADNVDLHRTVWGVGVDPATAWTVLTAETEMLRIGGGTVEVLSAAARALHVALHAAQHGGREEKPRQDLQRAGAMLPFDTWQRAAALARDLGAEQPMAAGLRSAPETAPLADRLGLVVCAPLWIRLRVGAAFTDALAIGKIVQARGLKAKAATAGRYIVPSPGRLRARYGLARRGPVALGATYLWWPISVAGRIPKILADIRRTARRAGGD